MAERAAGRAEDRDEHRRVPLEALDEGDPASDLRALVVDRKGGLGRDRELQLADLARERQHRDAQDDKRTERDAEADPEPGLGRGLRVGHDGQDGERRREQHRASHRPPADARARSEAPARRACAATEDRDDEHEREEPEQGRGGRERAAGDPAQRRRRDRPRRRSLLPTGRPARPRSSRRTSGMRHARASRPAALPSPKRAAPRPAQIEVDPRPSKAVENTRRRRRLVPRR